MSSCKKLFVLFLVAVTSFSVFAEQSSFQSLMQKLNSARYELVQPSDYLEKFEAEYMQFNPDYYKSITYEEAMSLIKIRDRKESVSYSEAVEDVDLFFRMLRYRHGVYDILGGDPVYYAARDAVLKKLSSYKGKTVPTSDFVSILISELGFIKDCHLTVDDHQVYFELNEETERYVTYLSGLEFKSDNKGYYLEKNGKAYYFQSCDNDNTMIVPMLTKKGDIIYSLVLYCPYASKPVSSTVILKGSDTIEETVKWKSTLSSDIQTEMVVKDIGKAIYVGLTGCGNEVDGLTTIGRKARNKDIVIVDLRKNGGTHAYDFMYGYKGSAYSLAEAVLGREGMTNVFFMQPGEERTRLMPQSGPGRITKNSNLTIVLVDNDTGCAPEEFIQYLRFLENTIVVGTNTRGVMDGGITVSAPTAEYGRGTYDMINLHLPNTGIAVCANTSLSLFGNYEFLVGKGLLPDLYVADTTNALDSVLALLIKENLLTEEEVAPLRKIEEEPETIEELPDYRYSEAVKLEKVESKYGTYYEARFTVSPSKPIGSFIFTDFDPDTTYRIEVTTTSKKGDETECLYINNGMCGLNFGGNDLFADSPIKISKPVRGTIGCTSKAKFTPYDVIIRFCPTDDNERVHALFSIKSGKVLLPLPGMIKEKRITKVYEFDTNWSGDYKKWKNNPFI